MTFKGISVKFSTEDEGQYESIGKFWDLCAGIYGRDKLRGLGYNWSTDSIEYVIGFKNNDSMEVEAVSAVYPEACYKEVLIPESGWEQYEGYTKELGSLYGEIYKKGALTYEIEIFNDDDSCLIAITRELPELTMITEDDFEDVIKLYRGAVGRVGCVWDEVYPDRDVIMKDIQEQWLYGIRDDEGRVVAAIARDRDDEIDGLSCWTIAPAAELARLTVSEKYSNQGLARVLIKQMVRLMKEKGFAGVHYLVAKHNMPAIKSYERLQFDYVGDTYLFGHRFMCYEKKME